MTLFRNVFILFVAATLTGPVFAGASGYWVAPPAYDAHYCPSATSVEPGGPVTLNARAESCTSGKPAEDLDTYKDLNGNTIDPPPGQSRVDDTFQIEWAIIGPNPFSEIGYGPTWAWTAPCVPGTYTVKWRLSNLQDDGDPRKDATTQWITQGTITVTALPEVNITIPAGPGEYVNDVARIKAYASSPDGVSQVGVYIYVIDGNHFKGYMTLQPEGYYLFNWDTKFTPEGTHTIYVTAANSHGCTTTDTEVVFAHPAIKVSDIAFEQDHVLYDRVSDALVSRPQWKVLDTGATIDKPIAYTRNSQMLIRPKLTTENVSASVFLRYVATLSWDDNTEYIAEKTSSGVAFPYDQLPYYPMARGTVKQYGASQSIEMFIRKYQDSDWCPTGSTASAHSQIYHTLQDPSAPWGANQNVWTEVLHEACNWANGQSTATGVLTNLTRGLHSIPSSKYKYNRGRASFTTGALTDQTLNLNLFLDSIQIQGDCRDFSNYLLLLARSVGIDLMARRTVTASGFITNKWYPAGLYDENSPHFVYHQYGFYNNVFDAALRFYEMGDPPSNQIEENGTVSDYESSLVSSYTSDGSWETPAQQVPSISKVKFPTILWIQPGTVTTSSVEIVWMTNVPATSRVHYDTISHPVGDAEAYRYHTTEISQFPLLNQHVRNIGSLSSGTRYYFRLENSGKLSDEIWIQTQPEA